MFINRPLIALFCASFVLLTQPESAEACFMHGGGSPWGGFEPRAGGRLNNDGFAAYANTAPKLKVSLPSMIRAKVEQDETLTISYTAESEGPNIELLVDIGPGVTIPDNKINLIGKNGQHTFTLQPQASGIYRLMVSARDLNNKEIPEFRQAIYVNVTK